MKSTQSAPAFLLVSVIIVIIVPLVLASCGKNISESIDDATLTTRVKTALLNDAEVGGMRIDVDTSKGVVTLSGAVKSQADEQQAIAVAKRVSGVRDVKSTLQIQQRPPIARRVSPVVERWSRWSRDERARVI